MYGQKPKIKEKQIYFSAIKLNISSIFTETIKIQYFNRQITLNALHRVEKEEEEEKFNKNDKFGSDSFFFFFTSCYHLLCTA